MNLKTFVLEEIYINRIGELTDRERIERECPSFLEGYDQHPAAFPRRNGNRLLPDAADPGIAANLDFLQSFVVVDVLGILAQVKDDLGIAIGQESVQVMEGGESVIVDQILDELVQGKRRFVDF